MSRKQQEPWKHFVASNQRERAIRWLMCARSFSRRSAESHVANYEKNEAPRK